MDKFILFFLHNILIYSNNEEEHEERLILTLKLLREHKMYAKLSKCDFYKDKIHYLGYIISDEAISMDLENIEAILNWPTPRNVIDLRSFMGLAGYCRRFTKDILQVKLSLCIG